MDAYESAYLVERLFTKSLRPHIRYMANWDDHKKPISKWAFSKWIVSKWFTAVRLMVNNARPWLQFLNWIYWIKWVTVPKRGGRDLRRSLAKKTRLMVTPSCFVRGVNTQKARRNLIDHSTPPQTFSFLIRLGKTGKKACLIIKEKGQGALKL